MVISLISRAEQSQVFAKENNPYAAQQIGLIDHTLANLKKVWLR